MDVGAFTKNAPGQLVAISHPRKDWAFIPATMPPQWSFPASLWPLLAEAKESLGRLDGIGQTLPDPQLLLQPLQSREAISSSSIEGTYVTPKELLFFELNPSDPQSHEEDAAAWREVFNYGQTLKIAAEKLEQYPFCNMLIREMHATLMAGVRGRDKAPGQFRQAHVQIGASGRFVPPPWAEVARLMDNLQDFMNQQDTRLDPLVSAFLVHYQFEAIHPFRDGNGRVGRALLAMMIYKRLGHHMPWLYMSAFFEEYRDEYVANLFNVSTDGRWTEWVEFCLHGAVQQANDSIRRCQMLNRLRKELHERFDGHSPRTHPMIDQLFRSPVVTIPSVSDRFHTTYKTAKSDIERLVEAGILDEVPNHHPRLFYATAIMNIAYDRGANASELS